MPNRGKLVFNERCECEHMFVYNTVKRALNIDSFKKGEKSRAEKALKHVAHQVHQAMREYEGERDVARVLDALTDLELHIQHPSLPPRLGRVLARQVFEGLVGLTEVLEPTVEYVSHAERPGKPAPVNLYTTSPCASDSDGAGSAPASGDEESGCSGVSDCDVEQLSTVGVASTSLLPRPILLLEYARSPKEFLRALLDSPALAQCRSALERHGLDCKLKSGAKVFVRPEEYRLAVAAAKGLRLKPRHVIVSEELEDSLKDALVGVGKGVRPKSKQLLPPAPLLVKRTFLEAALPSSLRSEPNSDPVTASTSEANPRVVQVNPRST